MTIEKRGIRRAVSSFRIVQLLTLCLLCTAGIAGAQDFDGDGVQDNLDNCVLASNASQVDVDGDGWGNRCDGDYNNDNIINVIDLGLLKQAFFGTDPNIDMNDDGVVNVIDLGLFKQQFFSPPGPAGFAIWINAGDGDWEVASNWFPPIVPPAEAHVTIDQAAPITVSFPRETGTGGVDFAAASVTTAEDIDFRLGTLSVGGDFSSSADLDITGGTLDIDGVLSVDGNLALTAPGTLASATVAANGSGDDLAPLGNGVGMDGLTLQRDLVLGNAVQVLLEDGLTLDNVDVYLQSSGSYSYLRFDGSQTFGGSGTVYFSGTTPADNDNRVWQRLSGETLTIGADIAFDTDTGGGWIGDGAGSIDLFGTVVSDVQDRYVQLGGDLTVNGPVSASNGGGLRLTGTWTNVAGNTISMTGGGLIELWGDWTNFGIIDVADSELDIGQSANHDWSNDGTFNVSNSPATVGGTFLTEELYTITIDGPMVINGVVSNAGTELDLDLLPNGVSLATNATIEGGTVSGAATLMAGPANPVWLDGVTLDTDMSLVNATQVIVLNGLTLNNTDVSLNSSGSYSYLRFDGTQTLDGTGSVLFAGTTPADNDNRIWQRFDGDVLTVASGIAIESDTAGGYFGEGSGSIDLRGSVTSDVAGRRIKVGGDLTLGGPLSGSGGGHLRIDDSWINESGNTISMVGGGLLDLDGDWDNQGIVTVTNSEFSTGAVTADAWTNNGSITLVSSPATIGGSFDTANLHTIVTDDVVVIDGSMDNTGATFLVDTFAAGVSLGTNGTITGGSVAGTASLTAGPCNPARLIGVTLSTDMELVNAAQVVVTGGLTLDNVDVTLASAGTYSYLRFDGTQTLGGTGYVLFGGTTTGDNDNRIWQDDSGETLTIASGITIDTVTTGGYVGETPGSINLLATVTSDVSGRTVRIHGNTTVAGPVTVSNGGEMLFGGTWTNASGNTISASNGGLLELEGTWSNSGTISVSNTPLYLGGDFTTATLVSVTSDGNIHIDGNLDNTGTTLDLDLLPNGLTLNNSSTLTGGTVTGSSDLALAAGATTPRLDGVTLATDLLIPNGSQAIVDNGLTLSNANVLLSSDGSLAYLRFDGTGMQTLGGSGEVRFSGTTPADNDNRILMPSSATDLTTGSNVTLRTVTTGGRIGVAGSELVIEGAIISDADGRDLDLVGSPVTLEGSATLGDASKIDLILSSTMVLDPLADIDMDIGPSSHSTMDFDDHITLDGDLNLALVDGATSSPCDLADAFTWESFAGSFDAITGPDLGGGQTFDVIYLDTVGQLQTPGIGCTYEVSRWPGNTETASTVSSSHTAARGNDSDSGTYWCSLGTEPTPTLTVEVTEDVTVASIEIDNPLGSNYWFTTGRILLLNGSDMEVYNSGVVALSSGDLSHDVSPDTGNVRKIVFEGVTWNSTTPCIGEIDALGTQP